MNSLNTLINKVSAYRADFNSNLRSTIDHITKINDADIQYMYGTIDTILVKEDSVYAVIKKLPFYTENFNGDQGEDGGETFFNVPGGLQVHGLTNDEVFIKTNLSAVNTNIDRYKGKRCRVVLRKRVAIYAEVDEGTDSLTVFPAELLITLRNNDPDFDLFSKKNLEIFYSLGYTEQELEDLKKFTYDEKMHDKVIAFKDNAIWMNDTSKPKDNQILLDPFSIIKGLSNIAQKKSRDCHFPAVIFSGK